MSCNSIGLRHEGVDGIIVGPACSCERTVHEHAGQIFATKASLAHSISIMKNEAILT